MLDRSHPLGHVGSGSVLERLKGVPDPRSRRGRIYPLSAILALLLLGALEGEGSLRGMWMRGRKYWRALTESLGIIGVPKPPGLTTVWYVLQRVDVEALGEALADWVEEEAVSVDGKHLRGSKRRGEAALQVVAMAGQGRGQVIAQRLVPRGDEGAGAVALLSEVPLAGRLVSLDAGLMERSVVKKVVEKGGTTSG